MQQLTEHDASFLYADTAHTNANVTFVQSTSDNDYVVGGRGDDIVEGRVGTTC